jgi:hypothetical protein
VAEPGVESEVSAGILETAVNLGLDLEVSQRDPAAPLELADLSCQIETLADQVENAAIEGLDVAAVLLEQLCRW